MNQEKIGKFIATLRKEKSMTQVDLANSLGVSNKSISKWERGVCMPDLSLFFPLCEILDINVNELLLGEKIEINNKKIEKNIINTIKYSNEKIKKTYFKIYFLLIVLGIIVIVFSFIFMNSAKITPMVFSFIGISIISFGFFKLLTNKKKYILTFLFTIIVFLTCFVLDYLLVINVRRVPIFRYKVEAHYNYYLEYKSLFYKTYQVNADLKDSEYLIVAKNNEYNEETLPISIFNREKYGFENAFKEISNKDFSNDKNGDKLFSYIKVLPISNSCSVGQNVDDLSKLEFGCDNLRFDNDESKYRKAFLYTSILLFLTDKDINKITFNILSDQYIAYRQNFEKNYPEYKQINKNNFNQLVERKMYNDYFINKIFDKVFTGKYLGDIFTRTYKVLNVEEAAIPNSYYLTLEQYNKETSKVFITELEKKPTIEKNYEFIIQPEVSTNYIDDTITSIFSNSRIIGIHETNKEKEEQLQDKISRYY